MPYARGMVKFETKTYVLNRIALTLGLTLSSLEAKSCIHNVLLVRTRAILVHKEPIELRNRNDSGLILIGIIDLVLVLKKKGLYDLILILFFGTRSNQ